MSSHSTSESLNDDNIDDDNITNVGKSVVPKSTKSPDAVADDELQLSQTYSAISTLGETTAEADGSVVYRGPKGAFHRHQLNPRLVSQKDYFTEFTKMVCNGDQKEGERLKDTFFRMNGKRTTQGMAVADGMLAVFIQKGAKENLLRSLFHIGQGRYKRVLNNKQKKAPSGGNFREFTKEMIDTLHRFVRTGIPKELGYPCAHRQQKEYCTDTEISSFSKLYETYYLPFESQLQVRKMSDNCFYKYMKSHYPTFHLRRCVEDACDTCFELNNKLKDHSVSTEEKVGIRAALKNHGDLARLLRKTLSEAILLWKHQSVIDDHAMEVVLRQNEVVTGETLHGTFDRLMQVSVDENPPTADPPIVVGQTMEMVCEDFAGNLHTPWYGNLRPCSDYYASKLKLIVFVIVCISENRNYVFLWDERGMGKDMDAMCSVRFVHMLRQRNILRTRPADLPTMRFQVMDNCVGQNKSQAVFMFFALLSLTWYPDGFVCLFLLPGHSHFPPDRTVSWLKKSLHGKNLFLPEHFVQYFNGITSVTAEFMDHRGPNRLMFRGWDAILQHHFVPIPTIKNGGYTSFYFFEFKNGILTARKSPDAPIAFRHSYVQGRKGKDEGVKHEDLCDRLVKSIEAHIFTGRKTCTSYYLPNYLPSYLPTYLLTYLHTYLLTYLPTYLPT